MIATDCTHTRNVAPELALGVLDGAERAETLAHLDDCPACRTFMGDLTATVETLPLLIAEAEPPAGFRGRVLQRILSGKRRQIRRWPIAMTAGAAAAVLTVATAGLIHHQRPEPARVAAPDQHGLPSAANASSAAMIGAGGQLVGRIFATPGNPRLLTIAVDYAVPSGTYAVELRPVNSTSTRLGEIHVTDGQGAWASSTSARNGPASLALIDANGTVICQGQLPTADSTPHAAPADPDQ